MIPPPTLPAPRAALLLSLLLPALLLAAACSSDDPSPAPNDHPPPPEQVTASQTDDQPDTPVQPGAPSVLVPVAFQNDPALELLIDPDTLDLPGRFVRIQRDDREPILTLGLVQSAARLTYAATASHEVLSFDLLQLDPDIDPEEFFLAFARTVIDTPDYRGLDQIGVPRGIGDRARHLAFTVDGDDGDAVVLLRDDILVFLTYRHPPNLRQPVDIPALMRAVDDRLRTAPTSG